MEKAITIREYGAFCVGKENGGENNGYVTLESSTFQLLERFVMENNRDDEDGALEIMSLSARRGVGKIISVKNHVGIVSLNNGTVIEILPKIYSDKDSEENARHLVVKMLNTLFNISSKNLQTANLDVKKMNILEAFIRMFVDEVTRLTKQGLKGGYETLEDNLTCFKGKIKFSQHIRHNFAHKERVYVAYDEFTVNRPENKLLKSTLLYLHSHTRLSRNKKDIKNLLSVFSDVEPSSNYDADFSRIVLDRNTKAYSNALNWARVFLKKKSFTSFSGSTVSMALLFPMEKLFECYIATLLKRALEPNGYSVSTQDTGYYLFDNPRKFALRPDIVIKDNLRNTFIMDTKWKILSNNPNVNYGISQGDMYQMYAYHKKYQTNSSVSGVIIIYPKILGDFEITPFSSNDNVKVNIHFFDMFTIENSIKKIEEIMKKS